MKEQKIVIKICGQNNTEIIRKSFKIGIDYCGLIFVDKSPRFIDKSLFRDLADNFSRFNNRFIGVFANHSIETIQEYFEKMNFGGIQLHGNEDEKFIKKCKDKFNSLIIKSVDIDTFLNISNPIADYYLIDSKTNDGKTGGTNQTWTWDKFKNYKDIKVILSGGLNYKNIIQAKNQTGINFLDINSGVETKKGTKDIHLIENIYKLLHS